MISMEYTVEATKWSNASVLAILFPLFSAQIAVYTSTKLFELRAKNSSRPLIPSLTLGFHAEKVCILGG